MTETVRTNALDLVLLAGGDLVQPHGAHHQRHGQPRRRRPDRHIVRRRADSRSEAEARPFERERRSGLRSGGLDRSRRAAPGRCSPASIASGCAWGSTSPRRTRISAFVDLAFGFKPPIRRRRAPSMRQPSAAAGTLPRCADKGQCAGVVRLNIEGGIAVTAIGLITTRLPERRAGLLVPRHHHGRRLPGRSRSVSASRSPASAGIVASTAPATKTSCARAEEPDAERRAVPRRSDQERRAHSRDVRPRVSGT